MSDTNQQSEEEQAALNAALDAALDDFDDEEEEVEQQLQHEPSPSSPFGPPPPTLVDDDNDMDAMMQQMMQMMLTPPPPGGGGDQPPELAMMGHFLQQMQTQLEQEVQQMEQKDPSSTKEKLPIKKDDSNKSANKTTPSIRKSAESSTSPSSNANNGKDSPQSTTASSATSETKGSAPSPLDETIANLVESFAKNNSTMNGNDDDDDDDLMPNMAGDSSQEAAFLGKLMQGNPDALLEGMMEELMSKELMYEPIKQVAAEFPLWLEKHKDSLPQDELKQYVLHHTCDYAALLCAFLCIFLLTSCSHCVHMNVIMSMYSASYLLLLQTHRTIPSLYTLGTGLRPNSFGYQTLGGVDAGRARVWTASGRFSANSGPGI
eukprot:scaffold34609_cov146-Amphora_coffeaeformis.AAC.22